MSDIQLTDRQREAVEFGEGPLLIVAGAGTGKTMVITRRIAHLIKEKWARPEEILALTFTEKAAAEMSERVDVLLPYGYANVPISTFHAFGDRVLREFGLELGLNPDFQVLSEAEQVIFFREHLFDLPLDHYRPLSSPTKFIQAMLNVFSRAKDEDVTPDDYLNYANGLLEQSLAESENVELLEESKKQNEIAETYHQYQSFLAKRGKTDFGDLVALILRLFRTRPAVLQRIRDRYRFILVDEFQDTNYAQFQLVQLMAGDKANVTVVGDDDQSIYKFRGAAISNILTFMDIYPQAKQIVLTENFRSTQVILDTAYQLISHNNPDRLEVRNNIDKKLHAQVKAGPLVKQMHCDTLTTETDRVATLIQDLISNKEYSYGDCAILVRANSTADPFLRALNMKQIPWRFSGNRGLYCRPEIRLLMSFLRVLDNPHDSISLYHLACSDIYQLMSMEDIHLCTAKANKENRSLYSILKSTEDLEDLDLSTDGRSTIPKIIQDIGEYLELCRDNITGVVLYQFLTRSNYLKRLTQNESVENGIKIQNIARFFDVVWAFAQVAEEDRVIHFVRYLELLLEAGDDPGTAEADPDIDAVNILTVHKAKGLEWPVVFMVGLVANRFPPVRRRDPIELPQEFVQEILPAGDSHLQEERRLFYVGMTRAKERLYFTSSADHGGVRKRKVSPFVLEALDRPHTEEVSVRSGAMERIERFAPPPEGILSSMSPVPDESIINLSHYQIDDYLTCPLKYKYVHILRLPFFHHTIVYGKAVHAAVELYYRHKMNDLVVTIEDLFRAYQDAWRNIGFLSQEHEERRFEGGKETIRRFMDHQEASGIIPAKVEEKFSFMLGRNRVAGRWDRIDERDDEIVIADFKTSSVFQQDAADRKAKDSLQLAIYSMAYEHTFGRMPDLLELHFLESGLVGAAKVTEKIKQKTEERILKAAEGIRNRDYTAKPGYQNCRFCAYLDICPSAVRA